MSFIQKLNHQFSIDDQITVNRGPGGFPAIHITNEWASACLSLYGGQVLSYQPKDSAQDLLFLSPDSKYQIGTAIRGGVPICWPWFGPANNLTGKSHGFARTTVWQIESTEKQSDGSNRIVIVMKNNDESGVIWPANFRLTLTIIVGETLSLELTTRNVGDKNIEVSQALHIYLQVGDVADCQVTGLEQVSYIDKLANGSINTQQGSITFSGPMDRIYQKTDAQVNLNDPMLGRSIEVTSKGSDSTVIWNPGQAMKDMTDLHFKNMLCIEAASLEESNQLIKPGRSVSLQSKYRILPLQLD